SFTPPAVTGPGFGLGVAPTFAVPLPFTGPTSVFRPVPAPTTAVIGGPGSLIFPQIVRGGGWFTELSIANITNTIVVVRVDFFGPHGELMGSLPSVSISPGTVFFFSAG